ncbi:MAG: hypothetical protein R2733_16260 [Acidimicrobiales bacterium]
MTDTADRPSDDPSGSPLRPLADYAIGTTSGFVPVRDPLVDMPEAFAAVEDVVQTLAPLIRAGRVRAAIRSLPQVDPSLANDDRERERLFLALTVLTNAWVWSDGEPDLTVPANLAVPVCALAEQLGREPIVSHASMALQNWRRVHVDEPLSADNAELLVGFHGGTDETWFFTATLGVELAAAPIIADLHAAANAAANHDHGELLGRLVSTANAMLTLNVALERMREWCDPHFFYGRLRPFLAGWPEPGVVYEGVDPTPRILAGGSAGQSSVIQALDAALGVTHQGVAGTFLGAMRRYMPPPHRRFIVDLEQRSPLRAIATSGDAPDVTAAYDAIVSELDSFRQRHIRLSVDYIRKPSNDADLVGTGGSDFVELLRDARTDTLGARPRPSGPS